MKLKQPHICLIIVRVNIATAEGTFDATDDVFEIAEAKEARAIKLQNCCRCK